MIELPEKPSWLFLEINDVCNLRCKQCHIWMNPPAGPGTLTLEEQKQIIRDLKAWPGERHSGVVLEGGEALLNPERVLPLVRFARGQNVTIEIVSNGSLIDEALAINLGEAAPNLLHISIDAPRAEVHDSLRGVRGAFDQVVENVRRFNEYRDRRKTRLSISALVCKRTLPLINEHVAFARELGADQIRFLPLAPTIGNRHKSDPFYDKESRVNAEDLTRHLDPTREAARGDSFIDNSEIDLEFIDRYLRDPGSVVRKEAVCDAGARTMMIDQYGGIGFCFYMVPVFAERATYNVRDPGMSIRDHWNGGSSQNLRRRMLECKEPCGLLSCHRKNGPI